MSSITGNELITDRICLRDGGTITGKDTIINCKKPSHKRVPSTAAVVQLVEDATKGLEKTTDLRGESLVLGPVNDSTKPKVTGISQRITGDAGALATDAAVQQALDELDVELPENAQCKQNTFTTRNNLFSIDKWFTVVVVNDTDGPFGVGFSGVLKVTSGTLVHILKYECTFANASPSIVVTANSTARKKQGIMIRSTALVTGIRIKHMKQGGAGLLQIALDPSVLEGQATDVSVTLFDMVSPNSVTIVKKAGLTNLIADGDAHSDVPDLTAYTKTCTVPIGTENTMLLSEAPKVAGVSLVTQEKMDNQLGDVNNTISKNLNYRIAFLPYGDRISFVYLPPGAQHVQISLRATCGAFTDVVDLVVTRSAGNWDDTDVRVVSHSAQQGFNIVRELFVASGGFSATNKTVLPAMLFLQVLTPYGATADNDQRTLKLEVSMVNLLKHEDSTSNPKLVEQLRHENQEPDIGSTWDAASYGAWSTYKVYSTRVCLGKFNSNYRAVTRGAEKKELIVASFDRVVGEKFNEGRSVFDVVYTPMFDANSAYHQQQFTIEVVVGDDHAHVNILNSKYSDQATSQIAHGVSSVKLYQGNLNPAVANPYYLCLELYVPNKNIEPHEIKIFRKEDNDQGSFRFEPFIEPATIPNISALAKWRNGVLIESAPTIARGDVRSANSPIRIHDSVGLSSVLPTHRTGCGAMLDGSTTMVPGTTSIPWQSARPKDLLCNKDQSFSDILSGSDELISEATQAGTCGYVCMGTNLGVIFGSKKTHAIMELLIQHAAPTDANEQHAAMWRRITTAEGDVFLQQARADLTSWAEAKKVGGGDVVLEIDGNDIFIELSTGDGKHIAIQLGSTGMVGATAKHVAFPKVFRRINYLFVQGRADPDNNFIDQRLTWHYMSRTGFDVNNANIAGTPSGYYPQGYYIAIGTMR